MITSYEKMPIGRYLDLLRLFTGSDKPEEMQIVSILSGYTRDELLDMSINDYRALTDKVTPFLSVVPDPHKIKKAYNVGGFCLIPCMDVDKMTTAQYIDFQNYAEAFKDKDYTIELLTCFLVPNGKTYNKGYDIKAVREAIAANLPVLDALALCGFFISKFQTSINNFMTFSAAALKRMKKKKTPTDQDKMKITLMEAMAARMQALHVIGGGLQTLTMSPRLCALVGMRY